MKRFVEWYLEIPPAQPGEGTAWTLHHVVPWPEGWPDWCVLLLLLSIVLLTTVVGYRTARSSPLRVRALMIALRLIAVGLVGVFLCELKLAVERTGLPFVVLLIDDSASMQLEDRYTDRGLRQAVQRIQPKQSAGGVSRLDLAKSILTTEDGEWLARLMSQHKLRVYRFADAAQVLGAQTYLERGQLDALVKRIRELQGSGESTRPATAVRKVLADFRGASPAALVVISDGVSTTGESDRLSSVVAEARNQGVPIFTVGTGSEEPAKDLRLYDVLMDDVAVVGVPVTVSARIEAFNYKGQTTTLRLRDTQADRVLAQQKVDLGADGTVQEVELTFTPDAEGEFDLELAVQVLKHESNRENNQVTRQLSVRQGRIRILLADSMPRYEFRYLKHLLEREGQSDQTIVLHTLLQNADFGYVEQDESAAHLAGRFPVTREQLFEYDVVILGDLDPRLLSDGIIQNLHDFVSVKGGGLILISGPNHLPLAYRGTKLEPVFPVELDQVSVPEAGQAIEVGFRPQLTIQGSKGTPIFRFSDNERLQDDAWNRLPEMYWLLEASALKPGAMVLMEHRSSGDAGSRLPVISLQRYGNGKVLFHAIDELWRWRFQDPQRFFARYWNQAIRYLIRSKFLGSDRSAELTSDRLLYRSGESAQLRLRFIDESLVPREEERVVAMVERRAGLQQRVELQSVSGAPTVFEARLPQLANGSYHCWIVSPAFRDRSPAVDFRVERPQRELMVRNLDRQELELAAKETGGSYHSLRTVRRLPDLLPPGAPVVLSSHQPLNLWNRWELLLCLAAVLAVDWMLRKKLHLN